MSKKVDYILYIGDNIQLARSMLDLFASSSQQTKYRIDHLTYVDDIQIVLAEKKYSHFICERSLSQSVADNIALDFPLLKTSYLKPFTANKEGDLSTVIKGVISDEVKATLDYLSIPIYFKNRAGFFLACNSHFSLLFGKTPAQVIGKKIADIMPAYIAAAMENKDQNMFAANKVYFHEFTLEDQDGKRRDIVLRKESVANHSIQIGILFDVTNINEVSASLEKERIMLRATANLSEDLIFFKDREGRFLGCNKQFEKFVGCPEKDIIGKSDEQLFEFTQAVMCQKQDQQVIQNNEVYVGEEYLTYKNGERHFIEMKKEPLKGKNGLVQGLIAVGRDITEKTRIDNRLKIADTTFENAKECLIVSDENGIIRSVNKALCSASGYARKELIGATVKLFASNKHLTIEQALAEKGTWQGELSYVKKNGNVSFAWLEVYTVNHAKEGRFNRIYSLIRLDQPENVEDKIKHLAKYDPLTGIFNRIAFFSRLEDAIGRSDYKEKAMAVVLIDVNGFKEINEVHGHHTGDAILVEVARRLKECVFEKDTVARFGNHEFTIIIDELANELDAAIVAQKVAAQFEDKFRSENSENSELSLSAAIGIALCPDDGMDIDTLIDSAEEAMQRGKSTPGTTYHFYTHELTCHSLQQFELEKELQQALELEQFELYFSPQYNMVKRQVVAVEVLLRWKHPLRGVLEAEHFLSLAENSGLLVPIYMLMLRKAAEQAVNWQKLGIHFGRVNVSLSLPQLEDCHFIAELQDILLACKCSPQWLEFAVDETIFLSTSSTVHDNLLSIKKIGIAIMIDNYAADRPALYSIEKLGIEKLKLAKHYHKNMNSSYFTGTALVNAWAVLGRTIGVDVVGDSLIEAESAPMGIYDPNDKFTENKVMKASEAAFYLRCNKRK